MNIILKDDEKTITAKHLRMTEQKTKSQHAIADNNNSNKNVTVPILSRLLNTNRKPISTYKMSTSTSTRDESYVVTF
jgi:hypothetical protein